MAKNETGALPIISWEPTVKHKKESLSLCVAQTIVSKEKDKKGEKVTHVQTKVSFEVLHRY